VDRASADVHGVHGVRYVFVHCGIANADYYTEPYLSPLYSRCVTANCVHPTLPLVGSWWNLSPAILVVAFPVAFRVTCYYYRRSYYRALFWEPTACMVPDVRSDMPVRRGFPSSCRTSIGTSCTLPS